MLLKEGWVKYRKIIMDLTKKSGVCIDPFENSITLASLAHLIYRSNILKPDTLPHIPENGYNFEHAHSFKATAWLNYVADKEKISISHAQNKGEKNFGSYFVDGYNEERDTIYEFHGCYFHGCPKCYTPDTKNNLLNLLMRSLYTRHCERIAYLKGKCKNIVEIWECEWDKKVAENVEIKKFISTIKYETPLIPREALFGGRTNALILHHKCKANEKILYYDFTSLYPYVQKYRKYPVGHPIIIKENFDDVRNYFGFIKCNILPPRKLYLPVVPAKINDKLVYTLCQKCAHLQLTEECKHNDIERCLKGTWCTLEIHKAIELGYEIKEIFEVWHWNETAEYNYTEKQGGLFTDYINMFLKGKQEASGFPSDVITDEDKENYIRGYFEKEGVQLNKDDIEVNPAKRFVFKLFLNSMWGRLGMNSDRTNYKIITNPQEWFEMISDDQYIITSTDFSHDKCLQVSYKYKLAKSSNETSVVHAAFVTCYACCGLD